MEASVSEAKSDKGFWITPSQVYWWSRLEGGKVTAIALWAQNKAFGAFDVDEFTLETGDFQPAFRRLMLSKGVPVLLITSALGTFFKTLFYVSIFALLPMILNRSAGGGAFRRLWTFYLYASIPPLVIATVYGALHLPFLDMSTAFVAGFVGYLLLVFWGIRNTLQPEKGN